MVISKQKITPFFMFQDGNAEDAMNFYVSMFKNSEIVNLTRYETNESGEKGTVMHATFSLSGQEYMCSDSYVKHEFSFTPSISFYIACETEAEIDELFEKLSKDGQILMPLDTYPFSERFGWVNDRYGVSWQLSLGMDHNSAL